MRLEELIKQVRGLPVIDTNVLFTGITNPGSIQVQLSRWCKSGKLIKLKNNIYLLAEDFRKVDIYEPHIASLLKRPSYISLEKAFEFHGLIPEAVPTFTCITTKRPEKIITPIGTFNYQHIKTDLFWGYNSITVNNQTAFIACPEKALLDFFYLNKNLQINTDYLDEMRLQNLNTIDFKKLLNFAEKFEKSWILKIAVLIKTYAKNQK